MMLEQSQTLKRELLFAAHRQIDLPPSHQDSRRKNRASQRDYWVASLATKAANEADQARAEAEASGITAASINRMRRGRMGNS